MGQHLFYSSIRNLRWNIGAQHFTDSCLLWTSILVERNHFHKHKNPESKQYYRTTHCFSWGRKMYIESLYSVSFPTHKLRLTLLINETIFKLPNHMCLSYNILFSDQRTLE